EVVRIFDECGWHDVWARGEECRMVLRAHPIGSHHWNIFSRHKAASGDVVANRVSGHIIHGVLFRNAVSVLSNDYSELELPIMIAADLRKEHVVICARYSRSRSDPYVGLSVLCSIVYFLCRLLTQSFGRSVRVTQLMRHRYFNNVLAIVGSCRYQLTCWSHRRQDLKIYDRSGVESCAFLLILSKFIQAFKVIFPVRKQNCSTGDLWDNARNIVDSICNHDAWETFLPCTKCAY